MTTSQIDAALIHLDRCAAWLRMLNASAAAGALAESAPLRAGDAIRATDAAEVELERARSMIAGASK